MMKFIKYLPILLLSMFILISCEREDDGLSGGRGISFYLADDANTRANEIQSFVSGDVVGVYVLDKSAGNVLKGTGNFADNKKFIWDEEKKGFFAADNDNLIFNSPDRPLAFYVYFPYKPQVSDATALAHSIVGVGKEDDFLYAVNGSTDGQQAIPLSFNHLLSKVVVKYTSEENRDKTQMSVYTYTGMKVNLATGRVAANITDTRQDMALERYESTDHAGFVGVIAPQTYSQGEKFGTLSYTGGGSYPFSFAETRTFASGEESEVFFMPKQPAYVFSVTPTTMSASALDNAKYPFILTSTKSQAINGATLPGTTNDIGYKLENKPDWVTLSGRDITVAENRVATLRSGSVSWVQDESGYKTSIAISQAAALIAETYNFTLSDGTTSNSWSGVAATGGTKTYTITSNKQTFVNGNLDKTENITYSSTRDAAWITVSGSTITVAENRTTSVRNGKVTFTQATSGKVITVNVSQIAGVTTNNYIFTFSDGSTSNSWSGVAAIGATKTYTITSNKQLYINGTLESTTAIGYSGSGSVNWITVTAANVAVTENRTTSARNGTATFRQVESGKTIVANVSQSAGVTTTEYSGWTTTSLTLGASPNPVASTGGNSTLSCTANQERSKYTKWNGVVTNTETEKQSVSVTPSWSKVSGSGTLSGSTVTFGNNASASAVSGVYRASYGGKAANITVSQSAGSPTIEYGSWTTNSLSVSASPNPVASTGGNSTLSCTANQTRPKYTKWNGVVTNTETESQSIAVTSSWSKVSGSGTLSGSTVTFGNNTSTSAVSGVYRASYDSKTADITVSQSGGTIAYTYAFTLSGGSTSASWSSISATGDSKSFSIVSTRQVFVNGVDTGTENVSYSGSSNVGWASSSSATVTVGDNPNTTPRGGIITFTQATSGKTITVTLLQLKKNSIDIN